jgi:hypothetical protein
MNPAFPVAGATEVQKLTMPLLRSLTKQRCFQLPQLLDAPILDDDKKWVDRQVQSRVSWFGKKRLGGKEVLVLLSGKGLLFLEQHLSSLLRQAVLGLSLLARLFESHYLAADQLG